MVIHKSYKHRKAAENIGKHLKSSDIILRTTEDWVGPVRSGGDRLCQTRPIPRSPDGDNKKLIQISVRIVFYAIKSKMDIYLWILLPLYLNLCSLPYYQELSKGQHISRHQNWVLASIASIALYESEIEEPSLSFVMHNDSRVLSLSTMWLMNYVIRIGPILTKDDNRKDTKDMF